MSEIDPPHGAAGWSHYRTAIEQAGEGFFVVDTNFQILEVNDTLCAMLGYARDEVLGRKSLEFVAPGARDIVLSQRQIASYVERRTYRVEIQRRDGSCFPALVRAVARRGPDGALDGSVGFVTDLSEIEQAQQKIAESERELRAILDNMQDTYYRADLDGRIVRASKSAENLLGYRLEELIGRRLTELYYEPADRERFLRALEANGGVVRQYEARLRRSDGTVIWVSTNARYYRDGNGRIAGVEGTTRDVTEARRLQEQLRLAARVFETAEEGIVITDGALVILSVNPAFAELTGIDAAQLIGRRLADCALGAFGDDLNVACREAIEARGRWSGEVRIRCVDGGTVAGWLAISSVGTGACDSMSCIATFTCIGGGRGSPSRMAYLAHHDPLTQLPNRLLLHDRVDQAISRAARSGAKLALLFVDLDDFKRINDTFGHQTGDALLREIAGRLARCVRDTDTVSRYGGDEFVVALPDLTEAGVVERVARCIADQVSAPLRADGVEVRVSCSIGVALYPGDGADCDALVRCADASMYAAKRAGRMPD